ncbi:glycosyltransferase family 2 protein [bacterium]|jgi:GT2 family glycosyltransferase|nr:glycosyltransferase family 2 protein [bacterium]
MPNNIKNKPLVYILIRNHNAFNLSKTAISSLNKLSYKNFRILLIDDGSKDGSGLRLKEKFSKLELLKTKKYMEFCKSFNLGIKYALKKKAKYIFLVNNDTKNFSKNYLEKVVQAFQKNKKVGLVSSLCYDYNGSLRCDGTPQMRFGVPMETAAEGFIISAEALKKVGLFNQRLFRYFENIDLVIRLREAGYKTLSLHEISFDHLGGGTSSKQIFMSNFYRVRNIFLFIKKHCKKEGIKSKLSILQTNMKVHTKRLAWSFKNKSLRQTLTLILSISLGICIGLILPWKENHE